MYVYINEQDIFTEFDNPKALFWLEEELMYGDWQSGLYKDGSYTKQGQITISEVSSGFRRYKRPFILLYCALDLLFNR